MPEGDTVHRAARRLAEALEGRAVLSSDVRVPQHATVDLSGEVVDAVVARGKHLIMRIGPSVVHSHLKMEGSWHVYRPGTRWRRPAFEARIVLDVASGGGDAHPWQAVGFALGELDIAPRDREEELVGHLGPDPLGDDWNREEALRRLTADPTRPLGLALLDQRIIAGLGNDYRNETLFLRGILPERTVGEVDAAAALDLAVRLIRANRDRVERTTTGDTRRGRRLWVAHRDREPCRRCGTPVQRGTLGDDALTERITWFCPQCQH
ncbi:MULTISPECIES: Fpg/Nei family DNA glycosylase [Microcella]|uniref:Fpg/Nei family DNA glycosylase n=1 Tax=Microcella TaxID=337004 RepID=UPI0015CF5799|nr:MULTISPECIES: Fpg/Nei family DNA glycosylase [Microcella]QOD93826.1 Fpg/Nei family DNA glycosylase [Chryseoglobus sp. 28M-23]